MKLKVCGMNQNIQEVADLQPDYLGFIFWKPSKRYFAGKIPQLSNDIKKVGVFVDSSVSEVIWNIAKYNLDAVQLHGSESPGYCKALREVILEHGPDENNLERTRFDIIKVFSIKDNFDFSNLEPYEDVCDFYLFDTKGKLPGGNGYTFNWDVLKNYPSTKPYFLSGGIGLEEIDSIKEFLKRPESQYCYAIDVNSKFEDEPGLKNIEKVKEFKKSLTEN